VILSDASFFWKGIVGKNVIAVLIVLPSFVDRGIYFKTWRAGFDRRASCCGFLFIQVELDR
jgi:hypothetical protein